MSSYPHSAERYARAQGTSHPWPRPPQGGKNQRRLSAVRGGRNRKVRVKNGSLRDRLSAFCSMLHAVGYALRDIILLQEIFGDVDVVFIGV